MAVKTNMPVIGVQDIPTYIDEQPKEVSTMFIGDTGIGKTQVIKQYCEDRDIFLKTLILSQIEASECLGIPVQAKRIYKGKEFNTIETAVPTWVFDLAEQENCILYLDEFLCAEPSVMNAFLNFITEKTVNGIDLSHVKIVASTNIGNYTYDPDTNILSRFAMFYVENTEYNKYLKSKYGKKAFKGDYKDEEELDGIIFDQRSLKPRCQEMLCLLANSPNLDKWYQAYTMTPMMPVFHKQDKINNIIKSFAKKDGYTDKWLILDDDLEIMAGYLFKVVSSSKRTNILDYATSYSNIAYDQLRLRCILQELFIKMV